MTNSEFIAHARTDVLKLLEAVLWLNEELTKRIEWPNYERDIKEAVSQKDEKLAAILDGEV